MPPWMGPVTIGLGTVGLSTSRCDPAAGPFPLGLPFELESASALPAVMSPTASAAPAMARVTPADARPVIASPSSERRIRGARRGLRHRSSIPCWRIVDFGLRRSSDGCRQRVLRLREDPRDGGQHEDLVADPR